MEPRGELEVSTNVPPTDPQIQQDLCSYQNGRHASFGGFDEHGDAGVYITARFGDCSQIHRVVQPLGYREQLTFTKEPVKGCFPNPSVTSSSWPPPGFIYGQDKGGNEQIQFYLYNAHSGKHTLLTDGKSYNYSVGWCTLTGERIAFTSNMKDGVHFNLYVLSRQQSQKNEEEKDVNYQESLPLELDRSLVFDMKGSPGYTSIRSFRSNEILLSHYVSVTDSRLFLLKVPNETDWGRVDPERIQIAPSPNVKASVQKGVMGTNGIFYCSNEGTAFKTLRYYDITTRVVSEIAPEIPWDVEDIAVGNEGDVVVVYNEDGKSTFYYAVTGSGDAADEKENPLREPLQKLPWESLVGVVGKADFCRAPACTRHFGFSLLSANGPSDVFVADFGSSLEPKDVSPVPWTRSEVGGLNRGKFVKPHLIHYKSFDGLKIPAFVYCPKNAVVQSEEARTEVNGAKRRKFSTMLVPVVIHPHGGPEGQHRPRFVPFYQYLVCELGLAVIDPNVRGSAGYGKVFVSLDNCEKREDSVKDIGALLDWIDAQQSSGNGNSVKFHLDCKKIAVWGGSYGGYMCLASLIRYNKRFACGVDMVGISNFVTFLENTADYRRDLRRVKYGDERDPSMRKLLLGISPLSNAQKIVAPLFVVQGANDPRVALSEARQIFQLSKQNGQEMWWMMAKNEGHGFRKKPNIDAYQEAVVQFFKKFLLTDNAQICPNRM